MSFEPQQDRFRTFGRAKGRSLSAAQTQLMQDHWPRIKIQPGDPLPAAPRWLEIGYGMGSHLIHLAQAHRDISLIGAEPFQNGTAKVVKAIVDHDLDHLRLFRGDVRAFLKDCPDNSFARIFILFPDPWPKARHNKRRLIRTAFIEELARVIEPGGQLQFASDIPHYVDWTLTRLREHQRRERAGFEWIDRDPHLPPDGWPGTKYEAKARREGRTPYWFDFVLTAS